VRADEERGPADVTKRRIFVSLVETDRAVAEEHAGLGSHVEIHVLADG